MNNRFEKGQFVVGLPPWLFISLVLLVYGLRLVPGLVQAGIQDIERIEDLGRVSYAVESIEDGVPLFFPDQTESSTIDEMSMDQMEASMVRRHALLRDWLMGGACTQFRTAAAHALVTIQDAKYLSEQEATLSLQVIQRKKEVLASELEGLDDDELREIVRQESRLNPPQLPKPKIIDYLLEVDDERRERLSTRWEILHPGLSEQISSSRQTRDWFNAKVWRARFDLVAIKLSLWLSLFLELSIFMIPLYGLLAVLLPHWRGWLVEKSYGLSRRASNFPEVDEIQAFVSKHAPRVEVWTNFLRPDFSFVYSRGYRSPRLAVFGGAYVLWRNDREKAEGLLLHEIEHIRQGDHLLVGYVTFFAKYLQWLLIGFIILMAAHVIVGTPVSVGVIKLPGYLQFNLLYSLSGHYDKSFMSQVAITLSATVAIFFLLMTRIMVPLLGIWASELNADYGASQQLRLHMDNLNPTTGWTRRILKMTGSLTHPPLWLRKWLIQKDNWLRSLVRHLVFPCSYLMANLMFFLMGVFAKWEVHGLPAGTVAWLLQLCRTSIANIYWLFGGMALLVLIWPYLAGYWERFFVGGRLLQLRWDGGRWGTTMLLGLLAALAWSFRLPT